jgi:hypothetical protein
MNDPFESYKLYNALKLHFEGSYDAVKYNYKTNVTPKSFLNRKDKYFFAKLAKKYNGSLKEFYVSQFINEQKYVGDMMDSEAESYYAIYKKIKESIHRVFSIDINKIIDLNIGVKFDNLFESVDGQQPMIVQMWMQEDISLETVVILNSLLGFIQREDSKISDTIIWPDNKRKIEKYTPFVNFDINKCKTMLMEKFA